MSIDKTKHAQTTVLSVVPISSEASSAAIVTLGGDCGGIGLTSQEPSGIKSGKINCPGAPTVPLPEPPYPPIVFPAADFKRLVDPAEAFEAGLQVTQREALTKMTLSQSASELDALITPVLAKVI